MEKGLTFEYDEHADVLYISVGAPKPAISEEVDEGIIFRRDPATRQLTGLTIIDFRTTFLKAPKRLPVTLQAS